MSAQKSRLDTLVRKIGPVPPRAPFGTRPDIDDAEVRRVVERMGELGIGVTFTRSAFERACVIEYRGFVRHTGTSGGDSRFWVQVDPTLSVADQLRALKWAQEGLFRTDWDKFAWDPGEPSARRGFGVYKGFFS